jgi:hypothetical protein
MLLGSRDAYLNLRHDLSVRRFGMEDRAPVVSPAEQSSTPKLPHEGRGAWVLTAYGISGLALFGLLAYFFSDFIAH